MLAGYLGCFVGTKEDFNVQARRGLNVVLFTQVQLSCLTPFSAQRAKLLLVWMKHADAKLKPRLICRLKCVNLGNILHTWTQKHTLEHLSNLPLCELK